jgi:hypothetical protein
MQAAAATAVAVVAVNDEDCVQLRRQRLTVTVVGATERR